MVNTRRIIGILIVTVLVLALATPAAAITAGEPDNGEHPYVGLVGFYGANGEWLWRCSATLISPKVLLTAAHCTSPDADGAPVRAQVWFDESVAYDPGKGYPDRGGVMGTPIANPNYHGLMLPNSNDVGLVLLDKSVKIGKLAVLPRAGLLDSLANQRGQQDTTLTAVGYGINEVRPLSISLRTRYKAVSHVVNLQNALTNGYNVQTSNNPGNWIQGSESGGTCFGDSGGPVFLNSTNTVVAVTSFGLNDNCKGTDFGYRVDTSAARGFLAQYVALP